MQKPRKTYKGALTKPIPYIPPIRISLAVIARADLKEIQALRDGRDKEIAEAKREKLRALFRHYDIDPAGPDAWERLCIALADAHVPGFRMTKAPPGAKRRWTDEATAHLWNHIKLLRAECPGRSFAEAARLAAKSGHWKKLINKRSANPGETLRRRAGRADKELAARLWAEYLADRDAEKTGQE